MAHNTPKAISKSLALTCFHLQTFQVLSVLTVNNGTIVYSQEENKTLFYSCYSAMIEFRGENKIVNSRTTTPGKRSTLFMNLNKDTAFLKVTLFYLMLGRFLIMDPLVKLEHPSRDHLSEI